MADGVVRSIRLELLDGFRLVVDGHPIGVLNSAQRLLAYLTFHGPVPRVVAAGTLWTEVPERHALARLRTALWRCNRIVRGLITVDGIRLALGSSVRIDVAELNPSAVVVPDGPGGNANGSVPSLRSLRARELLPGWYDDWVIFERERLRLRRLHALEAASAQMLAAGHYTASLEFALEAVRSEPLRESAQRAVILVHMAQNNVAEAVRVYRRFRRLLLVDLGIEPSEELTNLVFAGLRRPARGRIPA